MDGVFDSNGNRTPVNNVSDRDRMQGDPGRRRSIRYPWHLSNGQSDSCQAVPITSWGGRVVPRGPRDNP